jgi:co-chaperonin GroES (HSP10)
MSVKIQPVGRRYLLEMEDITDRKVGHIHLYQTSGETTRVCKIISSGQGAYDHALGKFVPNEHKVGERVLISAFAGFNLDAKSLGYIGVDFKIVNEGEIMARIVDEEDN